MTDFHIDLPEDFEEYAWEVSAKGWFQATVIIHETSYTLTFYDLVRLIQEVESSHADSAQFFARNLVILETVGRSQMETAVKRIINAGELSELCPDLKNT